VAPTKITEEPHGSNRHKHGSPNDLAKAKQLHYSTMQPKTRSIVSTITNIRKNTNRKSSTPIAEHNWDVLRGLHESINIVSNALSSSAAKQSIMMLKKRYTSYEGFARRLQQRPNRKLRKKLLGGVSQCYNSLFRLLTHSCTNEQMSTLGSTHVNFGRDESGDKVTSGEPQYNPPIEWTHTFCAIRWNGRCWVQIS
jgi:hypothetical protein